MSRYRCLCLMIDIFVCIYVLTRTPGQPVNTIIEMLQLADVYQYLAIRND